MQFMNLIGDYAERFTSDAIKSMDGSWIAIQTDKPSYYAGETITGHIIVQNNSPRQCDRVLLKVSIKETTFWDEETARTIEEGEGEHKTRRTVYEHKQFQAKDRLLKEVVAVSQLPHMLLPGAYKYPFQYSLAPGLPGVAKFHRETEAGDPAWRQSGRKLHVRGAIMYKLTAIFDVAGVFSRDLKCKQEVVVNPKFDWSKMAPAAGRTKADVKLLCCIPRGPVELAATFDKAAYAAGETAQVSASIDNASEQDVARMVIKLMRFITLHDQQGRVKSITDVVASAKYPGVTKHTKRNQDMPLSLFNSSGALLPGTNGRRVQISYRFDVECDIACAPDVEVHMPIVIYAPAPAVWGLPAMGLTLPPSLGLTLPSMQMPPAGAMMPQPPMPMPQPAMPMPAMPQVQVQVGYGAPAPAPYPAPSPYPPQAGPGAMPPMPGPTAADQAAMAVGMAAMGATAGMAMGLAAGMNAAAAGGAYPGGPGSPTGYPPAGSPGGYPPPTSPGGYPSGPGGYPPAGAGGFPPSGPGGYGYDQQQQPQPGGYGAPYGGGAPGGGVSMTVSMGGSTTTTTTSSSSVVNPLAGAGVSSYSMTQTQTVSSSGMGMPMGM